MIGILLIQLGTPQAPTPRAVCRYLKEFLSDPRVIDLPAIFRIPLVHLLIAPARSRRVARQYRSIWTDHGSPLLVHTQNLTAGVQQQLGPSFRVTYAMRYGEPSITSVLEKLVAEGINEIRLLPLFPQYATASYGTAVVETFRATSRFWNSPALRFLPPFYREECFIRSLVACAQPILQQGPDHWLFSFHGLPERQLKKSGPGSPFCYRTQCLETAFLLAKGLNLSEDQFSVSFQSRLGPVRWIQPYTDRLIPELIRSGKKRIAVLAPSFVADCLETVEEIGVRYQKLAQQEGGELLLVPAPNSNPQWMAAVAKLLVK